MERLKSNAHFLAAFDELTYKQCILLLRNISDKQALILGDIAANILAGSLRMSKPNKEKLSKHRKFIRCLGSHDTTRSARRHCIQKQPQVALLLIKFSKEKVLRLVKLCRKSTTTKRVKQEEKSE